MIQPITTETVWLAHLKNLEPLRFDGDSIVIIAPHPDDETLAAGGLIAACRRDGMQVRVIGVTDGERAYANREGLGQIRRCEQLGAIQELGLSEDDLISLGFPDSDVASHASRLSSELSDWIAPTDTVFAPWPGDFHPDHRACGIAAQEACRLVGARLVWWFFWTWHTLRPDSLNSLCLRGFTLDDEPRAKKRRALECHRSQLKNDWGEPILPERLLAPAYRAFEVFATV